MKKTIDEQYEALKNQLLKTCFNKYTPATNTKQINKIANQMRYLEKFVQSDVIEL